MARVMSLHLHWAAANNNPEEIRRLLAIGAQANTTYKNNRTPLHYAAAENAADAVAALLAPQLAHEAAAHQQQAQQKEQARQQKQQRRAPIVRWLAEMLHRIYRWGALPQPQPSGPADANARDKNGLTPLHYAGFQNAHAAALVLLQHGADPNAKTREGLTPLHCAAVEDALESATLLVQYGANPNTPNEKGLTPALCAQSEAMKELLFKPPRTLH